MTAEDVVAGGEQDEPWYVLVEELKGRGQGAHTRVTERWPARDREHALRIARHVAFEYQPQHPMLSQGRTVYRSTDHAWVVVIEGATATMSFTVTVAQLVGTAPR